MVEPFYKPTHSNVEESRLAFCCIFLSPYLLFDRRMSRTGPRSIVEADSLLHLSHTYCWLINIQSNRAERLRCFHCAHPAAGLYTLWLLCLLIKSLLSELTDNTAALVSYTSTVLFIHMACSCEHAECGRSFLKAILPPIHQMSDLSHSLHESFFLPLSHNIH